MQIKSIVLLLTIGLSVMLSGCATNSYQEPDSAQSVQKLATVQNYSDREGLATWQSANVLAIDDKSMSYFFRNDSTPGLS